VVAHSISLRPSVIFGVMRSSLMSDVAATSCEAAVVVKPKARLCEPWVVSE
jgi:hypothetical protein